MNVLFQSGKEEKRNAFLKCAGEKCLCAENGALNQQTKATSLRNWFESPCSCRSG